MNVLNTIDIRTGRPFASRRAHLYRPSIDCESIAGSLGRARGLMGGAFMGCMLAQQRGKPTARDYVQDGLVFHFDGIENAGYGVHDPNATIWKDLTGNGYDATKVGTTEVVFDADCVRHTSSNAGGFTLPIVSDDNTTSPVTIEVCFVRTTGGAGNRTVARFTNYGTYTQQCSVYLTSNGTAPNNRATFGYNLNSPYLADMNHSLNTRRAFSVVLEHVSGIVNRTAIRTAYADGIIEDPVGRSGNTANTHDVGTIFSPFGETGISGSIYYIRYYNRALTADEVAANYAIDKARFGLP